MLLNLLSCSTGSFGTCMSGARSNNTVNWHISSSKSFSFDNVIILDTGAILSKTTFIELIASSNVLMVLLKVHPLVLYNIRWNMSCNNLYIYYHYQIIWSSYAYIDVTYLDMHWSFRYLLSSCGIVLGFNIFHVLFLTINKISTSRQFHLFSTHAFQNVSDITRLIEIH